MRKNIIVCLVLLLTLLIPGGLYLFKTLNANEKTPETNISKDEEIILDNNDTDKIEEYIANMTLEEKVGQMFMVRHPLDPGEDYITKYHLGGYIFFARDFEDKTKEEIVNMITSYQERSKIPMLMGVDEEGGTVNRLSKYSKFRTEPFKSSQELYQEGDFELIEKDTIEKAHFLQSFGINTNFAPVVDVSTNPADYMFKRSFGQNATLTSKYAEVVVSAMKKSGIASVLKHFPGYGNNVDTHTGISIDDRSYETFLENDFLPFMAGIERGADIVLVSHNIINSMDSENPASLSKKVHDILRNELNFTGVIITDDLQMDAIYDYVDNEEAAIKAILAGNDLICTTDFETQIPAVIAAVQNGTISLNQIDESVYRIIKLKSNLGLLEI